MKHLPHVRNIEQKEAEPKVENTTRDDGICRAEDYAFAPAGGEHKVKLPSGNTFLLRYPRLAYKFKNLPVAQSIAAKQQAPDESTDGQAQNVEALATTYYGLLCEVCVRPRVCMEPEAGELHPDRIRLVDAIFIARWAGGEIDANGVDLATFRAGKSRANDSDGKGGAPVRPVAKRPSDDAATGTAV